MANRLTEMTSLTVERKADHVVLTMTPQRAQLVADAIELGDADHTPWLDSLADLLRSAAVEETSRWAGHATTSPLTPRQLRRGPDNDNHGLAGPGAPAAPAAQSEPDAAPAFAEALALAAQAELIAARDLEELAVVATTVTRAAVAAAATQTQQAADAARDAQSAAATKIAVATAETVRRAAHLMQLQTDEEAERVASAAEEAAGLVALAVVPGTEAVNAETAAFLASTIRAAAVAKAEETALAAATVARAAATAAAEAAADRRRCGHGLGASGRRHCGGGPGHRYRDRSAGGRRPGDCSRSHPQLGEGAEAERTRQLHRAPGLIPAG